MKNIVISQNSDVVEPNLSPKIPNGYSIRRYNIFMN